MGNQLDQKKPATDSGFIIEESDDPDLLLGAFSQEQLDELERAFQKRGSESGLECLKRQTNSWKTVPVNVAVMGTAGAGKSAFINAVRGLTCDNEGYAEVGVTETTKTVLQYLHPANPLIKFWEVPDVGTEDFPKKTYLQNVGIDRFAVFVIMTSSRFHAKDTWLFQEIKRSKKGLYFVRTQVGYDVRSDKMVYASRHNPEVVIEKLRSDIIRDLKNINVSAPVFLIDSQETLKYEFDKLILAIINDLPTHQRQAMLLSMSVRSKNMVKTKVEQLRQDTWIASCTIACNVAPNSSVLPVSINLDSPAIQEVADGYIKQLGLDEQSLLRRASDLNVKPEVLADIVNRAFPGRRFIHDHIQSDSWSCFKDRTITGLHSFLLAIYRSHNSIEYIRRHLNDLLDKMEAVALEIAEIMPQDMHQIQEINEIGSATEGVEYRMLKEDEEHELNNTKIPGVVDTIFTNAPERRVGKQNSQDGRGGIHYDSKVDRNKIERLLIWLDEEDWAIQYFDGTDAFYIAVEKSQRAHAKQRIEDFGASAILKYKFIEPSPTKLKFTMNREDGIVYRRAAVGDPDPILPRFPEEPDVANEYNNNSLSPSIAFNTPCDQRLPLFPNQKIDCIHAKNNVLFGGVIRSSLNSEKFGICPAHLFDSWPRKVLEGVYEKLPLDNCSVSMTCPSAECTDHIIGNCYALYEQSLDTDQHDFGNRRKGRIYEDLALIRLNDAMCLTKNTMQFENQTTEYKLFISREHIERDTPIFFIDQNGERKEGKVYCDSYNDKHSEPQLFRTLAITCERGISHLQRNGDSGSLVIRKLNPEEEGNRCLPVLGLIVATVEGFDHLPDPHPVSMTIANRLSWVLDRRYGEERMEFVDDISSEGNLSAFISLN